jgi:hypothetical protein
MNIKLISILVARASTTIKKTNYGRSGHGVMRLQTILYHNENKF